jgi:hypothetical protein
MAAKKKAAPTKDKQSVEPPTLEVADHDLAVGRTYLKPTVTAALTMRTWNNTLPVDGLHGALAEQIKKVASGDLSRPENILLCQAHTLDFLFSELAQKAHCQQHMPNYEAFMRMALRAQNQCRCTLETLSNIKNPPVVFAKQANISNGHQQINMNIGVSAQSLAREENKNLQSKLLVEAQNGGTALDIKATGEAVPVNSELEALE